MREVFLRLSTIGFFDSGVGGLTVLREFVVRLRGVLFFYYGDNANAPYGNKSKEEILNLSQKAFELFASLHVDAAVIACNTVTTDCAEELRKKYKYRIFGVEPALKPAAEEYDDILVLATKATAESLSFQRLKERFPDKKITVYSPCALADDIEKNILSLDKVELSSHLPVCRPQAVVLGCTHYVLMKRRIEDFYAAPAFDGGKGIFYHFSANFPQNIQGERNKLVFVGSGAEKNKKIFSSLFPECLPFAHLYP